MLLLRRIVDLAVPTSVALIAFLHAHAIGALVDATVSPTAERVAPFAEARAAAATAAPPSMGRASAASTILARNPFDHTAVRTATTDATDAPVDDPLDAPPCDGVRATVSVRADDALASFAALDIGGRRMLQRAGGNVDDTRRIAFVASDRVWLEQNGKLCVARVFAQPPPTPTTPITPAAAQQSPLEKEITGHIAKTGPNEFQIDRGAVDRILEAQAELMKTPVIPEREGDRVVGFRLVRIRPGSVLSALGLESGDRLVSLNGIEVTSAERMLEAYARLRTGTIDRLTINVVRNGKPTNLDYVVR